HGTIKMFSIEKNFGFIRVNREIDLYFRSASATADSYFMRGDRVKFDIGQDGRGQTCAINVRLAR
ncbi:MAG: cold shock domain-containing protein, partial [Gorillibacterium sp.]|nr:cold shock domain-containing protein [Gorillibacterium sp.]